MENGSIYAATTRKGSVYAPARSPQQELSLERHRQSTRGHGPCGGSRVVETEFSAMLPYCRRFLLSTCNIYERLFKTSCRLIERMWACQKLGSKLSHKS